MSARFAQIIEKATAFRHELHRHPERTWQEHETADRIRAELGRLGIDWRACAGTGTVADLGPSKGPRTALRADIDALPLTEDSGVAHSSCREGVMHACGHDGHTASLLATAAWLQEHEAKLPGGVRLLFQPAEEGGHGAKKMIEEGCLEGVGCIYGYHNQPTMSYGRAAAPSGPVMVSNGYFKIVIRGSGGHASSPDSCRDPIFAASQFVTSVQQLVARNVAPQKAAVLTVSMFHGGTARNIIPDAVELEGTIRAAETELRDSMAERARQILDGICTACDVRGEFDFAPAYNATVNHAVEAERLRAALCAELGDDCLQGEGVPYMGGEDFSYYLQEIPGAYALVGAGRPGREAPLHSPRFDYNDELVPLMVRVWSRLLGAPEPPRQDGSGPTGT